MSKFAFSSSLIETILNGLTLFAVLLAYVLVRAHITSASGVPPAKAAVVKELVFTSPPELSGAETV